jgi:hypothetical protein
MSSPSQLAEEKKPLLKRLSPEIIDNLKIALWVAYGIIFVVALIVLIALLNAKDESLKIYAIIPGVIVGICAVILLIKLKSLIYKAEQRPTQPTNQPTKPTKYQ